MFLRQGPQLLPIHLRYTRLTFAIAANGDVTLVRLLKNLNILNKKYPIFDFDFDDFDSRCEILDQLRLEITYQYAISHIDLYEGRNNIVHAQESGYLPIRIGGRVRLP